MAKKLARNEEDEPQAKMDEPQPEQAGPGAVVMQPEGVLQIRVLMPDGREVEHVARAEWDGTVRVHEAPPPAPPVQDPDPISGR